jgi:protein involved in polysaccharide export with SLBB domain
MMILVAVKRSHTAIVLVVLAVVALGVVGCRNSTGLGDPNIPQVYVFPVDESIAPSTDPALSSVLRVGDLITVSFSDVPNPPAEIRTRIPPDGMLPLHFNVRVRAAGRIIPQLEQAIREAYVPTYYRRLTAIVRSEERFFFVGGEVRNPSRYPVQANLTVLRAIDTAGGFTDFAKRRQIELRRENGKRIYIDERRARQNSALDVPVLANDHIIVKRRL